MNVSRTLTLAVPFCLAALGNAQSVTLRFKPPVGTSRSFVMTTSMTQNMPGAPTSGGAIVTTVPLTLRVVSRSGNLTTTESKTGQATVSVPAGNPAAQMKDVIAKNASNVTSTSVVDELGNPKKMDSKGGSAAMAQMGQGMMKGMQGVSYPSKPVKVGDTWSTSIDLGAMMSAAGKGGGPMPAGMKMNGKIPVVYKLAGLEKHGAKTFAKITITMKGTATMTMTMGAGGQNATLNMSSLGTILVDSVTGMMESMTNISDNNTVVMGMNIKQHMVMTMKPKG